MSIRRLEFPQCLAFEHKLTKEAFVDTLEKGSNHDFLLLFPSVSDEVSSLLSLDHRGGESLVTLRLIA